jgi:hypothetical protein
MKAALRFGHPYNRKILFCSQADSWRQQAAGPQDAHLAYEPSSLHK